MENRLHDIKEIKRGAERLKWIIKLAEQIERIGSVEQSIAHRTNELEVVTSKIDGINKELEDKKAQIVEAEDRASKVTVEANAAVAESHKLVEAILSDAKRQASEIVEKAEREKVEKENVTRNLLEDAKKRSALMEEKARKAKEDVFSAEKELQEVVARIRAAKDRAIRAYQKEFNEQMSA